MRLISIMVELGVIVGGLGLETEAQCRNLAVMATTSIPDPSEALRLQEELATQFSLLSYGSGLGVRTFTALGRNARFGRAGPLRLQLELIKPGLFYLA